MLNGPMRGKTSLARAALWPPTDNGFDDGMLVTEVSGAEPFDPAVLDDLDRVSFEDWIVDRACEGGDWEASKTPWFGDGGVDAVLRHRRRRATVAVDGDDRAMDVNQVDRYHPATFPWTIEPMNYPVIIRAESAHRYVAQPLGIPEARVVATTQEEAVAQVTESLGDWLATARVIQVTVPDEHPDDPWLRTFGRSAADPDFPEFLEELQRQRTDDSPA